MVEEKPKESEISKLLEERKSMKKELAKDTGDDHEEIERKLNEIEVTLANECSEENLKKVMDNFGSIAKSDGSVNTNGMWNIKKRVFPKNAKIVPTAKRNFNGQIETNPDTLKKLYAETYRHRL